jgi:hypothetical protein
MTSSDLLSSSAYKQWRKDVEVAFRGAGLDKVAAKWSSCSEQRVFTSFAMPDALPDGAASLEVCSADPDHFQKIQCVSCDNRLCPQCARRHAARLVHRYTPAIFDALDNAPKNWSLRQIVLTTDVDAYADNLRDEIKRLSNLVVDLFDSVLDAGWRAKQGLLFGYEFGTQGGKLHFHCLHLGPFIAQDVLSSTWADITGYQVVHVKRVADFQSSDDEIAEAVSEALKYTTKFHKENPETGEVAWLSPDLLPRLHVAMSGTRRVRSYGVFYKVKERPRKPACCERCEAELVRWSVLDYQIFRDARILPPHHDTTNIDDSQLRTVSLQFKLANNFSGGSPPGKRKTATDRLLASQGSQLALL